MRAAAYGTRRVCHRGVGCDSKETQGNATNRIKEEKCRVPFWGLIVCLSTIALLQIISVPTRARLDKATVNGTVSDQSEAVVRGVHVTARNLQTGVKFQGTRARRPFTRFVGCRSATI